MDFGGCSRLMTSRWFYLQEHCTQQLAQLSYGGGVVACLAATPPTAEFASK
jgi:hypothetical protein